MSRLFRIALLVLAVPLLLAGTAHAKKFNPADYPLRVHLYSHNSHSHYSHHVLDWVEGEGRANLYENSQPTAFDYSYRCDERLLNNTGYETYIARWRKQDREIEVAMPVFGKPDSVETCTVKVEMKPGKAYFKRNGQVNEEPAEIFQQWMVKAQYDPEHGLNDPIRPAAGAAKPEQTE